MLNCPACGSSAADQSRFCASCGAPLTLGEETRLATTPAVRSRGTPQTGFTPATTDFDHGRFAPGAMLAGRYRVTGRIGRGGMGEVYRADDLRLGQQVALKFLPDDLAHDAMRLAQFHNEVRLARQVSHPNVCRVYDIGEDAGHTFLSMEYIDGEDLGSLLRRIGRLPADKALELSRQLCAGLAAAHERGVIHRDLKPANLMIDGEGRLRITDFGIAALTSAGSPSAGTPGYMAPELLAGAPAMVRSDLYALGLVLYELFTGKKAFAQGSLAEIVRAQQDTQPTAPSAYVRDFDPVIERAILRCLQREPSERPASALAVSAMLPGGDPLAAALAAGETPSPQMVAAAGEAEALAPSRGAALVAVALAVAFVLVLIADRTYVVNLVALDKPPAVLADRASEILRSLGYDARVAQAAGFSISHDYIDSIAARDRSGARWSQLRDSRGPSVTYWFRISPRMLVPMSASARPGLHDPPMNISGQAGVILDPRGRLIELHGVPPQYDESKSASPVPDWKRLFDAAGLDIARFTAADPLWTPRVYADTRAAWTGTEPEEKDVQLRVEAAAYRGRPVFFAITGPWTRPSRMVEASRSRAESIAAVVSRLILLAIFAGAALLAWHNRRRGRGDRQGAAFAATAMFVLSFGSRLLRMSHVADPFVESERFFVVVVAIALFDAGMMWVMYMAVEPAVRRLWPDSLMGWSRLVSGRVRDARVGRDLLYGVVAGLLVALISTGHDIVLPWFGAAPPAPTFSDVQVWIGMQVTAAAVLMVGRDALQTAGLTVFLLVLLRMLVRNRTWATVTAIAIFSAINAAQVVRSETPIVDLAFSLTLVALVVMIAMRLGLLTTIVMFFAYSLMLRLPLSSSFTAWYGQPSAVVVGLVLAIAMAGFSLARGHAPLFGRPLLDD